MTSIPSEQEARQGMPAKISPLLRVTGTLMIATVLGFLLPFSYLLVGLHFTDQPAAVSFALFRQYPTAIALAYYATALDGLLVMLMAVMVSSLFSARAPLMMRVATYCGVLGGLCQTIGDLRWPFLLPMLTNAYFAPHASASDQQSLSFIFSAVDRLLGVVLSEHLYYVFIGSWTILVGAALAQTTQGKPWLRWLGWLSGILFLVCSFEQFDFAGSVGGALLLVVVLSRLLWAVWMVLFVAYLLRSPSSLRLDTILPTLLARGAGGEQHD